MNAHTTANARWAELHSLRQTFLTRCEKYAALTLRKLCLPNGYDQNNVQLAHDYQSLGAQCVNHLSNKLMLALFAPSRPFFRLDPGDKLQAQLDGARVPSDELGQALSAAEKKAVRILDQRAIRPKMYEAVKHIIVTGNALMILDGKPRVLGLKNYVVKRAPDGTVLELLVLDRVHGMTLAAEAKDHLISVGTDLHCVVDHFRWIKRTESGDYTLTQWVGDVKLPSKFDGKWPEEKLPYRAITWDLADGDDYGTGLVEEYANDFSALSMMSEATVQAAILASEFRFLVNPAGQTKVEDLNRSRNGSALPGMKGDIEILHSNTGAGLQTSLAIAEMYITRIGRGFLMQSAVTRNAERVTAEEIRLTAEELETALGGAYSRISVDIQVPLALWLMEEAGQSLKGKDLKPTIVTGLDALSRTGDRDNLVLFISDVSSLSNLQPDLRGRMRLTPIIAAFAAARGLLSGSYLLSEDEYKQVVAQEQQKQLALQAASQQIEAQATQPPEETQ